MKRILAFFLIFLSLSFLVGATGKIDNSSLINKDYRIGDKLEGYLNMSVSNERITDDLKFNFGTFEFKTKIKDFLDKHEDGLYTCNPVNCKEDFVKDGDGETTKTFSLTPGNDKVVGFVLNGNNLEVLENGVKFDISSNAEASCLSQLSIDVSADGKVDWENGKSLGQSCGGDKVSSCYSSSSFDVWSLIGQEPYCERIKIGNAPSFDVKVNMKWDGTSSYSSDLIKASIYGPDKILKGRCNLGKPSSSGGESICKIDYVSKSNEEHFVCVSIKEGTNNNGYSLKARESGQFCGFLGDPGQTSTNSADYDIKVSPRKYDAIGSFTYNDAVATSQTGSPLVAEINNYLTTRYGGNCPTEGCIVPIKFSGLNQEITISNIEIKYKHSASNQAIKDKLHDLISVPGKLSMNNFSVLDLEKNRIDLPQTSGNYTLRIFLGNTELYKSNVSIYEREVSLLTQLHPRVSSALSPVRFLVFVDTSLNVSKLNFKWDFGDGSLVKSSNTPYIEHSLKNVGEYKVNVKAFDGTKQIASANFDISVTAPKEAINKTIVTYKSRISSVKAKKILLPTTYQFYIDEVVNLDRLETEIKTLESQYLTLSNSDTSDNAQYVTIINALLTKDVPRDIRTSSRSSVKLLYELNDINLEDYVYLFNEVYSPYQENQYKNEIFKWYLKNINVDVNQKTYAVYFDDLKQNFVSEFEVVINPNPGLTGSGYLVIDRNKNDLTFEGAVSPTSYGDVTGVRVDLSQPSTIKFSLKEDIDVLSLPMYFAPEFSKLNVVAPPTGTGGEEGSFWPKFLIGLFLVIVFVAIVYYFINKWYMENYEKSLFKNPNDLYNIMQFIRTSKARGMDDGKIRDSLVKAKWKKEQVNYAIKKFNGKSKFGSNNEPRRVAKI